MRNVSSFDGRHIYIRAQFAIQEGIFHLHGYWLRPFFGEHSAFSFGTEFLVVAKIFCELCPKAAARRTTTHAAGLGERCRSGQADREREYNECAIHKVYKLYSIITEFV